MKSKIYLVALSVVTIASLLSCRKNFDMKAGYVDLSNKAYIRIVHAAPGFRSIANAPDTFNFYIDSNRINSPFLTFGSVFPAAGVSSYTAIDAGIKTYRFSISSITKPDSTIVTLPPDTLLTGVKRTIVITDSGFLRTRDVYNTPLVGYYNLRFMHLVLNDTAGKTVDIYSTRRNGNVFTNVPPRTVIDFTALASNSAINDTFFVRRSGTTNNLGTGTLAFLPGSQRTYTLLYRGNGNLTTGTKARTLAIITNQ